MVRVSCGLLHFVCPLLSVPLSQGSDSRSLTLLSLPRSLLGAHLVMLRNGVQRHSSLLNVWTKPKQDRKLEESIATQLRELPEENSSGCGCFSFFFLI